MESGELRVESVELRVENGRYSSKLLIVRNRWFCRIIKIKKN